MKNGVTSTFEYGSDGLRRKMTVGANLPVHYLIDGQNVVRELQDVNENGRFYDSGTGELESWEAIATYLIGPRGVEYRENASGVKRWYLYDGLGSVIGEVDDSGELKSWRTYKAFGGILDISEDEGGSHKFCGSLGHTADDTGLTYMRARYYDPVIGRFVSEDPAYQGGNWYAYCENSPVNLVDQTGKVGILWGALISLLAAAGVHLAAGDANLGWLQETLLAIGAASCGVWIADTFIAADCSVDVVTGFAIDMEGTYGALGATAAFAAGLIIGGVAAYIAYKANPTASLGYPIAQHYAALLVGLQWCEQ